MQHPLVQALLTSSASASPAIIRAPAPASTPANQLFPQSALAFPATIAPVPQLPAIFNPISITDIPTNEESPTGTSSSSTIPTLACSNEAIGNPTFNEGPNAVTLGTGESRITDFTVDIQAGTEPPFESKKEGMPGNFQAPFCSRWE